MMNSFDQQFSFFFLISKLAPGKSGVGGCSSSSFLPRKIDRERDPPASFPFLLQTVFTYNWMDAFISKEKKILELVGIIFWREDIVRAWIPRVIWEGASCCLDHYPSLLNSRVINWANTSGFGGYTCRIAGQQQHTYSSNVNETAVLLCACVLCQMSLFPLLDFIHSRLFCPSLCTCWKRDYHKEKKRL